MVFFISELIMRVQMVTNFLYWQLDSRTDSF